jgi:hypothetical protein
MGLSFVFIKNSILLSLASAGFICFFALVALLKRFHLEYTMITTFKNLIDRLADWLESRQSALTLGMVGACLFFVDMLTPRTDVTDLNILMLGLVKYGWIFCFGMGSYMLVRKEIAQSRLEQEKKAEKTAAASK